MNSVDMVELTKEIKELFERVHNGDQQAIDKILKIKKEMGSN
ncbi:hypothetical protein PDJ82_25180 [Bacillus cereus group sp. TH43LC]|nr:MULTISPECIES: hypothetical protein [Bacillus cereus group]MCU5425762.1 hypothetical protein [Bacillus tropicus]MCU5617001.1 hypothetical protein [Bacillus cereus]MDA1504873.1 hypothetical protein [Bacillus cereus group sp. TH43LC]MDA1862723.1 hypothetical protein [Bacillus cereus group sp. BY128LC]